MVQVRDWMTAKPVTTAALLEIGWYDIVGATALVLVEWPERAGALLPADHVPIALDHAPEIAMSKTTPPSIPQRGLLEHKPTKVGGGLPVPTLVTRPQSPPPKQGDGKK